MIAVSTGRAITLTGALAAMGCSVSVQSGFGEQCINSIATEALRNPNSPTIAANVAAQVGLVPNANPNGRLLQTKQIEFGTPDGAMHYFAVQNASWERAALITLVPDANPSSIRFFIIDSQGNLLQASRTLGSEISGLDIQEDQVIAEFRRERELWRAAGEDATCGRP